jgi:diguanylate cyclase (GGDEF)-like protein
MLDVNGLKMVNDVFGHEAGDDLLKKTAKILKEECRSDDIISRFGGDEFVVLLPKTSYDQAELIISRIQKALEEEKNGKYVISMSAGWATKTDAFQDKQELLAFAEDSMYRKKIIESQKMRIQTIDLILENFHKLNPEEKIHSEKVSEICKEIGRKMKLDTQALLELEVAGYMHDIGKSTVKRDLLYKTGKLTASEIEEIKMHSEIGYRILKAADLYSGIAEHVLSHHEWWNGKGYPRALSSEGISLAARILAVAEAYQYMREERTFKEAYSHEKSVEELKKWAGTQFDPEIVKYFVD